MSRTWSSSSATGTPSGATRSTGTRGQHAPPDGWHAGLRRSAPLSKSGPVVVTRDQAGRHGPCSSSGATGLGLGLPRDQTSTRAVNPYERQELRRHHGVAHCARIRVPGRVHTGRAISHRARLRRDRCGGRPSARGSGPQRVHMSSSAREAWRRGRLAATLAAGRVRECCRSGAAAPGPSTRIRYDAGAESASTTTRCPSSPEAAHAEPCRPPGRWPQRRGLSVAPWPRAPAEAGVRTADPPGAFGR